MGAMVKLLVGFAAFVLTYRVMGGLVETSVVSRGVRVRMTTDLAGDGDPQDAWRDLAGAEPGSDESRAVAQMIHHLETTDPEHEAAAQEVARAIEHVLTVAEDQMEAAAHAGGTRGAGPFRRALRRMGRCFAA